MPCPYRDNFEAIVAYVREELPPDQQETFEAHYLHCDDCARDVLWVEKTTLTLQHYGQDLFAPADEAPASLRTKWRDQLVCVFENLSWSLGKWRPAVGYAALILIASGGFWLFHRMGEMVRGNGQIARPESMWDAGDPAFDTPTFEWPADFASVEETDLQQRLNALRPLYLDKKFSPVADTLALLAGQFPAYERQLRLQQGLSLFQDKKYDRAIALLSPLAAQEDAPAEALWCLAWAYREQNQIEPARQILQKLLARRDHPYHSSAQKLWHGLQR